MASLVLSRQDLYEQVWFEPMTKVAARYEVSSSYLARVCERLNVPRPARGYWARLEVGQAPARPPLPAARPGDELEWVRGGKPARRERVLPRPPDPGATRTKPGAVRRRGVHPLIAGAREHFEGSRQAESGHLRPSKRRIVDLYVSSGVLDRALGIVDKLFRSLEHEGHRVTFAPYDQNWRRPAVDDGSRRPRDYYDHHTWSPDRPTVVYVGTVAIGLTIFELTEETEVGYMDGKYVPVRELPISRRLGANAWTSKRHMACGRLCIRASSPYAVAEWQKQWPESRKGELRSRIPVIVDEIVSSAAAVAQLVAEGERGAEAQRQEWARQQERWHREQEERRRAQNANESRQQLLEIIAAWGSAKQIEAFFEDAEDRVCRLPEGQRELLLERLLRARELVGTTDPLERLSVWRSPAER